jgi:RNA polymerase sigma-70 factor (ECF subfamily)
MLQEPSFDAWMTRIRAGDADAAADLVRQYEKAIRVAVRLRLTDPRLQRRFDSMDVCQSVLASFFVRAAAGQYDLETPDQLVALLIQMARNKLLMQVRRHKTRRRDVGRAGAMADGLPVPDPAAGPVRRAIGRELLDQVLDRLDQPDRELAQRRAVGQGWEDIARDLGGTPQGHRMRLSRAVGRVAAELGLDDGALAEHGG